MAANETKDDDEEQQGPQGAVDKDTCEKQLVSSSKCVCVLLGGGVVVRSSWSLLTSGMTMDEALSMYGISRELS